MAFMLISTLPRSGSNPPTAGPGRGDGHTIVSIDGGADELSGNPEPREGNRTHDPDARTQLRIHPEFGVVDFVEFGRRFMQSTPTPVWISAVSCRTHG